MLDALYDSPIRLITCRHEQGAANAAEAYGKLTGRPGICLVTRGPGATQAAVGVHTAKQDSSPMLLLVGQVPRAFRGREAWQELDYGDVFGGIAKAAWEVDAAERIPEHMAEAYTLAISGRPGPVVLSLPEDVLAEEADVTDGRRVRVSSRLAPSADDLARAARAPRCLPSARSSSSARVAGRPRRAAMCRRICEANALPVAVCVSLPGLRRQPLVQLRGRARSGDGRSAGRAGCATPISCSRSAGGWVRCRRAGTRCCPIGADAHPRPPRARRARSRA